MPIKIKVKGCPSAFATLNNAPFITVPSGATENIQLVKEDLTPFIDYTVVGNVITVEDCLIDTVDVNVNGLLFATSVSGTFDVPVKNTLSANIGSKIGSDWIIANTPVTVKNTSGTTIATDTVVSGVSKTVTVPDCPVIPNDTTMVLALSYEINDTFAIATILTGFNGTLTAIDSTGLTGVVINKNNVATSLPFSVIVGDVIRVDFVKSTIKSFIKLTGNYA